MSPLVFPLLLIVTLLCKGQSEKCDVYPKDPVITMGDDIKIMFKAPYGGLCSNVGSYSPGKLSWMLNNKKIPESFYTIVNSTIAAVNIQNFTLQSGIVTCHTDVGGNDSILGGTTIKAFFLPTKPTNISCITIIYESFACSWESDGDPLLQTNYTVSRDVKGTIDTCSSDNPHCVFARDILFNCTIRVTAQNSRGSVDSDVVSFDIYSTVKVDPPRYVAVERLFNNQEMKVSWEMPSNEKSPKPFICEVKYSYPHEGVIPKHVKYIDVNEPGKKRALHIKVQRQCTSYNFSIRCATKDKWKPMWSDWSSEWDVISPLDVRSIHLCLWRKIGVPDERGNRTVQLMWKGPPTYCDAIKGYNVTLKAANNDTQAILLKPADTKTSMTVGKEAYIVRIVAYRNENIFSEATTTIPAIGEVSGFPPLGAAKAFTDNGQIHVSWNAPSSCPYSYMVDWSADGDDYRWQESQATNITVDGQPLKLYTITVTPLYGTGPGQETTLQAYAKEGVPGMISSMNVLEVSTTGARIRWSAVPRGECCGFVVNYTVFYKTQADLGLSVTVNNTVQEVWLDSLQPSMHYGVHVVASSVAGGTSSRSIFFKTLSYGPRFATMLGLFGGLGVIMLLMIALCCFIIVKKHFIKSVPNPGLSAMASWSPHGLSQRPLLMHSSESCSICVVDPSSDGTTPTPTPAEHDQQGLHDGVLNPVPDFGPSGVKCPWEPSGALLHTPGCPAPGAWERSTDAAPHSRAQGKGTPVCVYPRNYVRSENGIGCPCGERQPAPPMEGESRTLPEPQLQRVTAAPPQAYISMDMLHEGMFNRGA
ncbi:hypothetical protein AAFF_G00374800 [Aldrovandia affinis]|uniref:Fibronectin type-III domain-containing protein n=1 Tax=Aldrovandia affinis TaxID=143900 RepID=A0AAD7SG49_9TELE|nr:hypothetical protein AAFF_G00374800 [Aldrovandia affinis]